MQTNIKYKSPLEWILKKSFENMTADELKRIKIISSLVFGFLLSLCGFLLDRFVGRFLPLASYIFIFVFASIGWYFLFWSSICKIRKIKK